MKEREDKVTIVAGRSGIVVETRSKKRRAQLRILALCLYALGVITVIFVVIFVFANHDKKQKESQATKQKIVQQQTDVNAIGDLSKLGTDSDKLIKGATDGTYKVTDAQLAQAYANRGDVEFNSGNEKAAISDYKQAVKLDASQQQLVGFNEFVSRYHAGERKSLISLLETLQKPYKNNYATGMQEHYEEYQNYIDSLKAGKELDI